MKQIIPTCLCGQPMEFKPGETRTYCKTPGCGVVQARNADGYWAYGFPRNAFTPIFAKVKLNHYQRYMRWRNGKKGKT